MHFSKAKIIHFTHFSKRNKIYFQHFSKRNNNLDDNINNIDDYFIYLDPPYFDNKNKGLYGKKGELHKGFDHLKLFEWVDKHSKNNKVMLSYDDSPYIRELYKNYNIYSFDFVYSMTNTGGHLCKEGKEIVITNYEIE